MIWGSPYFRKLSNIQRLGVRIQISTDHRVQWETGSPSAGRTRHWNISCRWFCPWKTFIDMGFSSHVENDRREPEQLNPWSYYNIGIYIYIYVMVDFRSQLSINDFTVGGRWLGPAGLLHHPAESTSSTPRNAKTSCGKTPKEVPAGLFPYRVAQ